MERFAKDAETMRDADRIRAVRRSINRMLEDVSPETMRRMTPAEMSDVSKTMEALECMLAKYQERREMRRVMEDLVNITREVAGGISQADWEIAQMSADAEHWCRRIRETRIGACGGISPDDHESVRRILEETSVNHLTKTTTKVDHHSYKQDQEG